MDFEWWWLAAAAAVGAAAGAAAAWQLGQRRLEATVKAVEGKTKSRAEHLALRATRRLREEVTQLNAKLEEQAHQLKEAHAQELQAMAKQLLEAHDSIARSSATPTQARAFARTTLEDTNAARDDAGHGFAPTAIDDRD